LSDLTPHPHCKTVNFIEIDKTIKLFDFDVYMDEGQVQDDPEIMPSAVLLVCADFVDRVPNHGWRCHRRVRI
jgi:hypothetical protein